MALMTFKFTSFSESGQDAFAYQQNGGKPGTFLDIGSGHPLVRSNSAGLEMCGWRGLCIDKNPEFASVWHLRRTPLIVADAKKFDFVALEDLFPNGIDYLSLDADGDTLDVLHAIRGAALQRDLVVRFATIEHDGYCDPCRRELVRRFMGHDCRFQLHTPDVATASGLAYEDWWVSKKSIPFTQDFDRVTFTA